SLRHTPLIFPQLPRPPRPTLFPYTTLFRSSSESPERSTAAPRGTAATAARWPSLQPPSGTASWRSTARGDSPGRLPRPAFPWSRSEEHTSELQSPCNLVCRLLLEKKNKRTCPRPLRPLHRIHLLDYPLPLAPKAADYPPPEVAPAESQHAETAAHDGHPPDRLHGD